MVFKEWILKDSVTLALIFSDPEVQQNAANCFSEMYLYCSVTSGPVYQAN